MWEAILINIKAFCSLQLPVDPWTFTLATNLVSAGKNVEYEYSQCTTQKDWKKMYFSLFASLCRCFPKNREHTADVDNFILLPERKFGTPPECQRSLCQKRRGLQSSIDDDEWCLMFVCKMRCELLQSSRLRRSGETLLALCKKYWFIWRTNVLEVQDGCHLASTTWSILIDEVFHHFLRASNSSRT